jgi:uncharacterized membrane protein YecN with MAPEG domain
VNGEVNWSDVLGNLFIVVGFVVSTTLGVIGVRAERKYRTALAEQEDAERAAAARGMPTARGA